MPAAAERSFCKLTIVTNRQGLGGDVRPVLPTPAPPCVALLFAPCATLKQPPRFSSVFSSPSQPAHGYVFCSQHRPIVGNTSIVLRLILLRFPGNLSTLRRLRFIHCPMLLLCPSLLLLLLHLLLLLLLLLMPLPFPTSSSASLDLPSSGPNANTMLNFGGALFICVVSSGLNSPSKSPPMIPPSSPKFSCPRM